MSAPPPSRRSEQSTRRSEQPTRRSEQPTTRGANARGAKPARRGQGQWALGYREPLNPNERAKRDSDGLAVRQRIIDIYSKTGFAGIDPE